MIRIELSDDDLKEWTARLDMMVRAGGLGTVHHAAFFMSKLQSAIIAAQPEAVKSAQTNVDADGVPTSAPTPCTAGERN